MQERASLERLPAVVANLVAARLIGGGTGAGGAQRPQRPAGGERDGGRVQGDGTSSPPSGRTGAPHVPRPRRT
jgi:hypothetical protein